MQKKFLIEKKDTLDVVIKKILEEPEANIVLVIPRGSLLKESINNFRLIKKEADQVGKTILIESVDEDALSIAKEANLEGSHPLFHSKATSSRTAIQDIIQKPSKNDLPGKALTADEEKQESVSGEIYEQEEEKIETSQKKTDEKPKLVIVQKRFNLRRIALGLILVVIVIFAGMWGIDSFFGRASIVITLKKTPWSFQNTIVADKSIASIDAGRLAIPGEFFIQQKNFTQVFPASQRKEVSQKASAKIEIYNAYDTHPQILVATTRFTTADGKLLRLADKVTVPGGTMQSGKLTPSRIEATVIADKPGTDYNAIAVDSRLDIPGFQGSPRYGKFYGILKSITQGFVGEKAVASDKDVAAAKQKITDILKTNLKLAFFNNRPHDFVIPDGAFDIAITKMAVNQNTDEQGNFIVFGEATIKAAAFREKDLKELLAAVANKDLVHDSSTVPLEVNEIKLTYSNAKPNFDQGQLQIAISAVGTLKPTFSLDDFRSQLLGRSIQDARNIIIAVPVLSDARITLWPRWLGILGAIPKNPNRITVTAE